VKEYSIDKLALEMHLEQNMMYPMKMGVKNTLAIMVGAYCFLVGANFYYGQNGVLKPLELREHEI